MEDWEFLLQKEGDRSWLPINTRKLQIGAGRYRIVAHTSRTTNPVEVRIVYQESSEVNSESISQQHSRRINSEGMLMVIPYIFLKPGIWKLSCSGDILADLLNESWREELQLQIVSEQQRENLVLSYGGTHHSQNSKLSKSSPEPKKNPIAVHTPQPSVSIASTSPTTASNGTQLGTDSPSEAPPPTTPESQTAETTVASDSPTDNVALPLIAEIVHDQDFSADSATETPPTIINKGETALIIGTDAPDTKLSSPPEETTQSVSSVDQDESILGVDSPTETSLIETNSTETELIIGTDSPEEIPNPGNTTVSEPQPLPEQVVLNLDREILVRDRQQSMLISGYIKMSDDNRNSQPNQLFYGQLTYQVRNPQTAAIITNIQQDLLPETLPIKFQHQLEIASEQEIPLLLGEVILSSQVNETVTILDRQTFHVTAEVNQLWESVADSQSDEDTKSAESTDLLELTTETQTEEPLNSEISESTVTTESQPPESTSAVEQKQNSEIDLEAPLREESESEEALSQANNPETETTELETSALDPEQEANREREDAIDKAFHALNLTKRFWIRIFSLARDQELLKLLKQMLNQESTDPDLPWEHQEAVVEDQESAIAGSLTTIEDDDQYLAITSSNQSNQSETLSIEQLAKEIPIPLLSVTEGELVAGKTIAVRVKLPPDSNSMYVKLWLQDCQSHYILEGPRNLVEFVRNQDGELESLTQVTVPLGSMEIIFEAVAVDLETQRESYKVTEKRMIVPENLPGIDLSEFED